MTGAMNKGMWASTSNTPSPSDTGTNQSPIRNEDEDGLQHVPDMSKALGSKSLPFEFRVLEVCLESACRCLETEVLFFGCENIVCRLSKFEIGKFCTLSLLV